MKSTGLNRGLRLPSSACGGLEWRKAVGGVVDRIFHGVFQRPAPRRRLDLLERIGLAPRQSLVLVEAEGRKLLIGVSADASPTFYVLEERGRVRVEGTVC